MRYRYYLVDVFSDNAFGGNQLAVLPEAQGLSDVAMQTLAREFNFSESTFVLPPDDPANTRKVRIFTPQAELPFAGHPNVGTAFALVAAGDIAVEAPELTLRFEEKAGLVPVKVSCVDGKPVRAELTAPQAPSMGDTVAVETMAQVLGLEVADIVTTNHPPQIASAGAGILFIELRDRAALARSKARADLAETLLPPDSSVGLYIYTTDTSGKPKLDVDIRARMFAPQHGIVEDPATGGAAAALAGLLATLSEQDNTTLRWRIAQGVEMGRPSFLEATADKQNGAVTAIRVAGASVLVGEGWIEVPDGL